jgi:hypothetical protein
MSGPDHPYAPPPDVPEEFSATYREAYLRALAAEHADVPAAPTRRPARLRRPWGGGQGRRWLLPAAVAAGAVVLVVGAYVVGVSLSDSGPAGDAGARRAQLAGSPATVGSRDGGHGTLIPVRAGAISADCTAPPGVDSTGRRVSYAPENAIDDNEATAWRCPGAAVGQKLVLRLGKDVDLAQVGLVPGYAKTDPASGVDRYAENNRITRVRWTLDDGVRIVQRLDPDPSSRAMQVLSVPRTTTDTVILEVLAVRHGPRDTTAISTIGLWAAR